MPLGSDCEGLRFCHCKPQHSKTQCYKSCMCKGSCTCIVAHGRTALYFLQKPGHHCSDLFSDTVVCCKMGQIEIEGSWNEFHHRLLTDKRRLFFFSLSQVRRVPTNTGNILANACYWNQQEESVLFGYSRCLL